MSKKLLAVMTLILVACLMPAHQALAVTQLDKPEESGDDRVYRPDEVDEKAVIDRKSLDYPSSMGCKGATGRALVLTVLRKTGQVTDAVLRIESGCEDFDRRAVKAALKVKFKPAMKDGQPVSQRMAFEFNFTVHG